MHLSHVFMQNELKDALKKHCCLITLQWTENKMQNELKDALMKHCCLITLQWTENKIIPNLIRIRKKTPVT